MANVVDAVVRLVSEFLRHAEHGVNELAGSLPRTTLGGYPDDDAPPVVPVFNDADEKGVAANLDPPEVPALVVFSDSSASVAAGGYKIARDVMIGVGYVTEGGVDEMIAGRACGYVLRGAQLSLWRYNSQEKSAGMRELNGVKILEIKSVEEQRVTVAVGRRKLWGLLLVNLTVVDNLS